MKKVNIFKDVKKTLKGLDYLPQNLTRLDFDVIGYVLGDKVGKSKDLTEEHFDAIQFISYSQNPKELSVFFTAVAWRKLEGNYRVIVCKLKDNDKAFV